jgi:putative spermidine/putrescine transport system ATP-binding protein
MSRIVLDGVARNFGSFQAVKEMSLEIADGEFLALLGPSGCGKTTTLRMVAGFVPVSSGRIYFGDRDVTDLPPNKRDTGHMTVKQNVSYGLEMRRVPKVEIDQRVAKVLERVRLGHLADRYPRQLSGGQQQRVALARALVINPHVLLLDEPLSALDAKLRHEVRMQIRQLQQSLGLTTIFVTHDQEEALSLADRLVVMNGGAIEQVGTPEDLYERPATPFVADFIGKTNFFGGRLQGGTFITSCGLELAVSAGAPAARLLGIRPEKIVLDAATGAGDVPGQNVIPGTVELVSYLGSWTEYSVKLSNDRSVLVRQGTGGALRGVSVGDPVRVVIPHDACFLFEDDAGFAS